MKLRATFFLIVLGASLSLLSSPLLAGFATPAPTYPTGARPTHVAAADFNGDGHRDLAVTNFYSNTVSILLGVGDGTFGAKADFATGSWPAGVAAADFNGDGHLDLAVTNNNSGTVSILLGVGDGTFGAKMDFATGGGPWGITIADFNEDGIPDLAVANNGGSVSILTGNGDGSFNAKTDWAMGDAPYGIAVADFNGDGHADLVVGGSNSNVVYLRLGNGDGSFQAAATTFASYGFFMSSPFVSSADLNGDGYRDIVGSSLDGGTLDILLGNGDGTFRPPVGYSAGVTQLTESVIADFDGDGVLDIAVSTDSYAISLLRGNGDGTFQAPVIYWLSNAFGLAAADFNGDGTADLAITGWYDANVVSILLQEGAPVLSSVGVSGTTQTGTTLSATSNEVATGYWIVVPQGSAAPTAAQVKAGANYGAVTLAASGNGAMAATVAKSFGVTGLSAATAYDLYLVAEDGSSNLTPTATLVQFTTAAAPVNGACGGDHGLTLTTTPTNLCTTGAPSTVTSGTTSYTWSCAGSNGGSDASCSATRNYVVTASVSGGNGTISASQNVAYNATPSFTLTPNAGYVSGPVSGTCGGTLSGNSYTTNAVTASCTVVAGFSAVDTTPDPFSFTAQTGAALSSVATSNAITVSGINTVSPISIAGGSYSINGGAYTTAAGTVNNGDTVTVRQTSSGSYSTLTTASLTIGGVSGAFNVTTLAAPVVPTPDPTPTGPVVSCLGLTGIPSGFSVSPCILDLGSGDGTGIISGLTTTLANTLGLPNFSHQNQSGSGTVVMQYDGGKLAFLPLSVQTGDPRPNGIYPVGNGKYVVVTNGTAVTVAPGIINLAELGALIPGWTVQVDEQGIVSASHDGTTYVVQPGYLVQLSSGGPSLWMGSDGYPHFTDSAGNSQTLYPAFLEPSWLLNYLLALDGNASLSIQLDGTALIRLFGQNYVLAPDLILGGVPAEHSGENWWQDGERHYQMRNRIHFGTTQGFTVR